MKKIIVISFIAISLAITNCGSYNEGFKSSENHHDAIQIAISDFIKKTKLYEQDSVFSVELLGMSNYKDLIVVRIGKNNRKMLLTAEAVVGSKGKLASNYLEKDGKLFFWWDDNNSLTQETINVFHRYGLLQEDQSGTITVPDFIVDDSQKAAHYYFCKENFATYKRVITNKGVGYYPPPKKKLKCN